MIIVTHYVNQHDFKGVYHCLRLSNVCLFVIYGFHRRLLNKDIRREKRKSLNNLTASQIQLGKNVKGNRAAMAAVAAFTSSKKTCNEPSSSSSALTAANPRVSRWKRNKVHPSNVDNGSRPSLNRSVSKETQKSVIKSRVTLNSLAASCISGTTTLHDELGSDISGPSSTVSQHQSKWPSAREVLSSHSMYPDDVSSVFSDVDSAIVNEECSL